MKFKKEIIVLSLLNVLKSLLLIVMAFNVKYLIDFAVAKDNNVFIATYILLGLIVLTLIVPTIYNYLYYKYTLKVEVYYRKEIERELLKKDIKELQKFHSGEIDNYFFNDVANLTYGITQTIPAFVLHISRFVFSLVALCLLDWMFLLCLLGFGILTIGGGLIYSKYFKKHQKEVIESEGKLNSFFEETVQNVKLIKSLNATQNINERMDEELKNNELKKRKRNNFSLIGSTGVNFFFKVVFTGVIVLGAFMLFYDKWEFGTFIAISQVSSYIEGPLSSVNPLLNSLNSYRISKSRINNIYQLKDDYEQINLNDFDEIIVKDLSFKYEDKSYIFNKFNLVINKNDCILLKGKSGIGKSTLFNLLLGFIEPESGSIKVKYNNEEYDIKNTRKLFSLVSQDNILFSGTIRDNFKLLTGVTDENKIIEALKVTLVYDEIKEKANGLDTKLIERGAGLSLGQIQRVSLAIALLIDRPILLLDEFTSSLDKDLEKKIVMNITKINKTKLIITHRDINVNESKVINLIGAQDD